MKKTFSLLIIFLFIVFCVYSQKITLGIGNDNFPYIEYRIDTIANFQVGPGTYYVALRLTTVAETEPPIHQNVFFLKADLRNPHLELRQVLGRDALAGLERPTVQARRISSPGNFYFAGINGDFFDRNGRPISGNIVNSEIALSPNARRVFAIDEREIPDIGQMIFRGEISFDNSTHQIYSINRPREENELVLFNHLHGQYTQTDKYGTELLIELLSEEETWRANKILQARVLDIETNRGNMLIPARKAVLSGSGTAATWLNQIRVGDVLEINLSLTMNENAWAWAQMTGGDPRPPMLMNGVLETDNVWLERHPRTAIGFTASRDTLIMTVVDGRSPYSAGVNTLHLAQIMQSAGAWTALNLDGGGSSTILAEPFGYLNRPSDRTGERAAANSVFLVSTAPDDNEIAMIKPHSPVVNLPIFGRFSPQFFGYNQYGVLLDIDLQGVVLSAPAGLGFIDDGKEFMSSGTDQSGVITATFGNATTEIRVNFIETD